jgi:hypothetical protein
MQQFQSNYHSRYYRLLLDDSDCYVRRVSERRYRATTESPNLEHVHPSLHLYRIEYVGRFPGVLFAMYRLLLVDGVRDECDAKRRAV